MSTKLYIIFNQYHLPYDLRDSTETLHRRTKLARLYHRSQLHKILFLYNYVDDPQLIDDRDINTRREREYCLK